MNGLKIGLSFLSVFYFQFIAAQNNNDFVVGIYDLQARDTIINGCEVWPTDTVDPNGNYTSPGVIFGKDGFNTYLSYKPSMWTTENKLKSELLLAQKCGLKVHLAAFHYYQPEVTDSGVYLKKGENIFDYQSCPGNGNFKPCEAPMGGNGRNYYRPNYHQLIANIYTRPPFSNIIWGHHIQEEGGACHPYMHSKSCQGNWRHDTAMRNEKNVRPCETQMGSFIMTEIPPENVAHAINYFKQKLALGNIYGNGSESVQHQKLVIMEEHHNGTVNENCFDDEHKGQHNPKDYLPLLDKNDPQQVYFEGSYNQFSNYAYKENYHEKVVLHKGNGQHYLGPIASIDYAKQYTPHVHDVIEVINEPFHFHTDPNIPNGNWLWFKTYTAIIHGVEGVWFYGFNKLYTPEESLKKKEYNYQYVQFNEEHFPALYKNYVRHIARELRVLVNRGLLSNDPSTWVASKTAGIDKNCIVPPIHSTAYQIEGKISNEKFNDLYSLRYNIRSNGNETIMIVSNPLLNPVSVLLDFKNQGNPQIQKANGVEVLFSQNKMQDANSKINLKNNTIGVKKFQPLNRQKELLLQLPPMGVKVLKFTHSENGFTGYKNYWTQSWSNNGNGYLGSHQYSANDKVYIGDFDTTLAGEEILLVTDRGKNAFDWMTLLGFKNGTWVDLWSNAANPTIGNGIYKVRHQLAVGDFDGNGQQDLVGIGQDESINLFQFNGNAISLIGRWESKNIRDVSLIGDFNDNGKDEIIVTTERKQEEIWELTGTQWTEIPQIFSDNLAPYSHRLSALLTKQRKDIIQFSWGDVTQLENTSTTESQIYWSTHLVSENNFFSGIKLPTKSTHILSGNLDGVNGDELLFIQAGNTAEWATQLKFDSLNKRWNWVQSSDVMHNQPFIDDWPLASLKATNYFLVQVGNNPVEQLMCTRAFCGKSLINFYAPTGYDSSKYFTYPNPYFTLNEKVMVFPNPSSGKFNIEVDHLVFNQILVYSVTGKILKTQSVQNNLSNTVDLSEYPFGVYYLQGVNKQQKVWVKKIILTPH